MRDSNPQLIKSNVHNQLNELTSRIEKASKEVRQLQEMKVFLLPMIMSG